MFSIVEILCQNRCRLQKTTKTFEVTKISDVMRSEKGGRIHHCPKHTESLSKAKPQPARVEIEISMLAETEIIKKLNDVYKQIERCVVHVPFSIKALITLKCFGAQNNYNSL